MKHIKFDEVLILVHAGLPVLLTGEKGSGKTTLAKQIAEGLKFPFFSMSMTRQTTLSHLLGFMSVNGTYVPSQLRGVIENGGVFLLDEIDAGDANVLLALNTIENGFVSFPDKIVDIHKDFRLMATSNPQDQHEHYVGRSKLDAATLDRFDIIDLEHDELLEKALVGDSVFHIINAMREALRHHNASRSVSMRDALRYKKRQELKLLDGFMFRMSGKSELIYDRYLSLTAELPKHVDQSECDTLEDLYSLLSLRMKTQKDSNTTV